MSPSWEDGGVKKFLTDIVIAVFVSEQVQVAIKNLLGQLITERVLPLVPVAVGAAVKAAMDELIARVPGVDGAIDVVAATDAARHSLNEIISDVDFDIPSLDALLDFWRPR